SDKSQSELSGRIIAFAQHLHPEQVGVKIQRGVEIAHSDHRVQQSELLGVRYRLGGLGHICHCHLTLLPALDCETPHLRAAMISRIWWAARKLGGKPFPSRRRMASPYPRRCAARTCSSQTSSASEAASRSGVQFDPSNSVTSGSPSNRLTRFTCRTFTIR